MAHFGFPGRSNHQAYCLCSSDCKDYYENSLLCRPLPPVRIRFLDMPEDFRKCVVMGVRTQLQSLKLKDDWDNMITAGRALNKIKMSMTTPLGNEKNCEFW